MEARIIDVTSAVGLTAVQFTTSGCDTFDYITGARAIKQNLLEVKEFTDAGSVNRLIVLNKSDKLVFMMDGDILVGAKQNRVLNTSVLLAPRSKTVLPVSCVEQGRWNYVSKKFDAPDYAAPHALRSLKAEAVRSNLKMNKTFDADQGGVWKRVGEYQASHKFHSRTGDLSEIYDHKKATLHDILAKFYSVKGANGVALYRGKTFCGMDVFNRSGVLKEYFPKLIQGVALDLSASDEKTSMAKGEPEYRTLGLLDEIELVEKQTYEAVGLGVEKRFEMPLASGLVLEYESRMIHLALLQKDTPFRRRS